MPRVGTPQLRKHHSCFTPVVMLTRLWGCEKIPPGAGGVFRCGTVVSVRWISPAPIIQR